MDLTEHRLTTTPVYDGVLLHVRRDTVRLPDGGESVREWIEHPGAAAVVPLFADGSTVLLRQFRYPTGVEYIEIPAGKLDVAGESPETAGRRELREEAGLEAQRWTYLGETHPGIGYTDEVIHLYLAEDLCEVEAGSDDDEFVVPVRLPFAEAVARAKVGELRDAKTCVAILLADAVLQSR